MNGNNAISFTELDDLARCAKLYEFRHIDRLQRQRKATVLRQGSVIHKLLQAFNLGMLEGTEDGHITEMAELEQQIDRDPTLFDDEKQEEFEMLNDSFRIVEGYLRFWDAEIKKEEILHVEETFVSILDNGMVVSCTPDVVIRRPDGAVVVRDYKSTSQTPSYTTPSSNLQVVMNFASVQALYPEAVEFQFDRLRKKVPTQPRLNKTKDRETGMFHVNDLNRIDTTFEILRDFLSKEAPHLLDEPKHRMRLAELRDENRFYYRESIFPTAEHIANGLEDVAALGDNLEFMLQKGRFPRSYLASGMRSCDTCEMKSLCQGELLGWDTEAIIKQEYEERDTSYKEYEIADL